ncbi:MULTISPECIES: hypothetical protein [Actinomadura]|uniref:Uncharacterized protein n=1 Tax=Actinomadura yumaensis TaxID=111807 RepID=A0ABW2CBP9_9ACTN|nr:hypothetical protein [Actinomadura sp. J1-007]MWK33701.1 hypothetical protein [Actinomadura sp. J1-007]
MYVASSNARRLAAAGLALAAVAIPVQIAGGMNYPVVPPGLILFTVGALIALFVRPRWAMAVPTLIAAALSVGAVATPNLRDALGDPGEFLAFAGSLVQSVGLVAGLAGCLASLRSDC